MTARENEVMVGRQPRPQREMPRPPPVGSIQ
jgi:hypothetical protein